MQCWNTNAPTWNGDASHASSLSPYIEAVERSNKDSDYIGSSSWQKESQTLVLAMDPSIFNRSFIGDILIRMDDILIKIEK
jgi:hypothetical protein